MLVVLMAVSVLPSLAGVILWHYWWHWRRIAAKPTPPYTPPRFHHHLRPEADDDIVLVQSVCADLSIPHAVLSWQDWDGQGNLQAHARMARRHLIAGWAAAVGAIGGFNRPHRR